MRTGLNAKMEPSASGRLFTRFRWATTALHAFIDRLESSEVGGLFITNAGLVVTNAGL